MRCTNGEGLKHGPWGWRAGSLRAGGRRDSPAPGGQVAGGSPSPCRGHRHVRLDFV